MQERADPVNFVPELPRKWPQPPLLPRRLVPLVRILADTTRYVSVQIRDTTKDVSAQIRDTTRNVSVQIKGTISTQRATKGFEVAGSMNIDLLSQDNHFKVLK